MSDYPLPPGHFYGPQMPDIRSHPGGDESPVDQYNIRMWQRKYNLLYDRNAPITGKFDGPTQRAATWIQREYGLDVSGTVDGPTWNLLMSGPETPLSAPQSHEQAQVATSVADTPTDAPTARQSRRGRVSN